MKTLDLELPTHWACALINGDDSGFCDEEQTMFDAFVDWMVNEYGSCHCMDVSDDDGGDFRRYHDATDFGVLACDVATFTFDITKR